MTSSAAGRERTTSARADAAGDDPPIALACAGCGWEAPPDEPFPARCRAAVPGDDIDHLMTRRIDATRLAWPHGDEVEPYLRYRHLTRAWHLARAAGWSEDRFVRLVDHLDEAVARVDGHGFRTTRFQRCDALSGRLSEGMPSPIAGLWVKDETGNVSGSHKARHLMGVMIEWLVEEQLGRLGPDAASRPFAIASCGNAALAAAVVARAADRHLDVFVPESADPVVIERLRALHARIEVCPRRAGVPGDPTYHRLQAAIAAGAVPFTCQGNENGLAIGGGQTLGWELADQLAAAEIELDRLVVQVGGGALGSAVWAGLQDAHALGRLERLPRLDTVQTEGAWPLRRAHERVLARLDGVGIAAGPGRPLDLEDPAAAAVLDEVARHRSAFMWPWEQEPHSVAHGILDDETYDWFALVRAMLASGGRPIVVDEPTLFGAADLARICTGIDVDETGSSGLAGVLASARDRDLRAGESIGVLFTGIRRSAETAHPASGGISDAAPSPQATDADRRHIERSAR
jgi:threonine synthase